MPRIVRLSLEGLLIAATLVSAGLPARAEKLPAGTQIVVRLETDINPAKNKSADFRGSLASPVFVGGKEVLPVDTRVEGQVRGDAKRVVLSPRYLYLRDGTRVDFNAVVKETDRKQVEAEQKEGTIESKSGSGADTAREAAQVGMAGAGVGAMTTRSAKGMGIGAAVGAGAVLIGHEAAKRRKTTYIPAGTRLTLSLARDVDIPDGATLVQAREERGNDPDSRRPILHREDPPQPQ